MSSDASHGLVPRARRGPPASHQSVVCMAEGSHTLAAWASCVSLASHTLAAWASRVPPASHTLAAWASRVPPASHTLAAWASRVPPASHGVASPAYGVPLCDRGICTSLRSIEMTSCVDVSWSWILPMTLTNLLAMCGSQAHSVFWYRLCIAPVYTVVLDRHVAATDETRIVCDRVCGANTPTDGMYILFTTTVHPPVPSNNESPGTIASASFFIRSPSTTTNTRCDGETTSCTPHRVVSCTVWISRCGSHMLNPTIAS